jgi:hypothetical protein
VNRGVRDPRFHCIYLTAVGLTTGGSSTSHIYTPTAHIIQRKENWEVRAVPRLCELYPGICLVGTSTKTHKTVTVHSDLPPLLTLFCDIIQRIVLITYRNFGTNYWFRRQGSRNRYTLCNIPEDSIFHLLRARSPKSDGLSFPRTWAVVLGMYELYPYIYCVHLFSSSQSKITTFVPNRSSLIRRFRETAGSCHGMSRRTSLEVHAFQSCICLDAGYLFCRSKRTRGAQPASDVCLFIHQRINLFQSFTGVFSSWFRTRTSVSCAVRGICHFTSC